SRSNPQRMSMTSLASQIRVSCARSIACRLGSPITTLSPPPPVTPAHARHRTRAPPEAPAILQPDFNARVPGRLWRSLSQLYFQEFHSGVFAQPFLPRKEVWST